MEFIPKDPILEFPPDTLDVIRKLYNLDNGRMAQSVDILDEWIRKQNHFRNKSFSRGYLERTIVVCKGSVEKAKLQIDKLCTLKTLLPKFFVSSDVNETFSSINKMAFVVPFPKLTKDYQRIYFVKVKDKEIPSEQYLDFYRLNLVFGEYLKAHDYNNGFLVIYDFSEGNLLEIMTKLNLTEFQQLMTIMMEGFGAKMKGIHLITQSKVIDMFVKMIKSVLSEKLGQRIHVHADLDSLYRVIDKCLLPEDLGGKEKPLKELQELWMEVLSSDENEKYLAEMSASSTNESLRQTDKFNEQHMGLAGSFRTLTVD